MKKLIFKISSTITGILAFIGITSNSVTAVPTDQQERLNRDNNNVIIENIDEYSPLYLYHADQIVFDNGELITQHYSHQSHQSHYSHQSHQSHYSHYSSY